MPNSSRVNRRCGTKCAGTRDHNGALALILSGCTQHRFKFGAGWRCRAFVAGPNGLSYSVKEQERVMTPARWRQIEELYLAAKERDPTARELFLTGACEDDAE